MLSYGNSNTGLGAHFPYKIADKAHTSEQCCGRQRRTRHTQATATLTASLVLSGSIRVTQQLSCRLWPITNLKRHIGEQKDDITYCMTAACRSKLHATFHSPMGTLQAPVGVGAGMTGGNGRGEAAEPTTTSTGGVALKAGEVTGATPPPPRVGRGWRWGWGRGWGWGRRWGWGWG